ncbi:patatin-like phospholipase family protein [Nocardioides sp. NPDC000445]|uniref:patatin-like phospholipase family protein n=1 Tax=Nocardioides sp. NPDC000445 TaxID=3154257 RepID=UPI0033251419
MTTDGGNWLQPDQPNLALGMAISGGGLRAALYALGSTLFLVHSGLNEKVRLISSVSGGSILNAILALDGDFTRVDARRFTKLASRLGHRLSKRGVFFFAGIKRLVISLLTFLLFGPLFLGLMSLIEGTWVGTWEIFWFLEVGYAVPMTFFLLGFTVFGRKSVQQEAYGQCILHTLRPWHDKKALRRPQLRQMPESAVTHVLCATELTSGQPIYMSREMILSPRYGRGDDPELPLQKAIYASAAFPIGFPPLRVKSDRMRFAGGVDDMVPTRLVLSDGGVFNNLGTDAFAADRAPEEIYLPDPSLAILPDVNQQLIVNASAPPKKWVGSNWPIVRAVTSSARIMSVLYENTLTPRIQSLLEDQQREGGPLVVDISESPIRLLERLGQSTKQDEAERAAEVRESLLKTVTRDEWDEYADRAACTKTVLSPVGRASAVRLVRLGYFGTAAACHVRFETGGPKTWPTDRWFQDLIDGQVDENQLVPGTANTGVQSGVGVEVGAEPVHEH